MEDETRSSEFGYDLLDGNYRGWSNYAEAYLQDYGTWDATETPCPVVTPLATAAASPEGEPAGSAAARAAAQKLAMDLHEKQLKEVKAWKRKNVRALAQIKMAVKPHLMNMIADCKTAAEVWECLRVLFDHETATRRGELEEALATLRKQPNETIMEYVGRTKGIRDDLATAGVNKDEHSFCLDILRGLPAPFKTIRTVLRNSGKLLTLPTIANRLMETELRAESDDDVPQAVQAYLAAMALKKDEKKGQQDKKPVCFYCKKPGHKIADCNERRAANEKHGRNGKGPHGGDKGGDGGGKKLAYCTTVGVGAVAPAAANSRADTWVVDSGATHHLATGKGVFVAKGAKPNDEVALASGGTLATTGRGEAILVAGDGDNKSTITLKDTYRVPGLRENLMSVGLVDKAGGAVLFANGHCDIYDTAKTVASRAVVSKADAIGHLEGNGQYTLGGKPVAKMAMMASAPMPGTASIWHRRFFHLGYNNLQRAAKMVDGLPEKEVETESAAGAICRPCVEGKTVKAPFPASNSKTDVMELIHVDITGPFKKSPSGSRYLIVLYEDSTGMTLAVPIRAKSEAGRVMRGKIPEWERRSGKRLKRIRFDGAKEFTTAKLRQWYEEKGIDYEVTLPYSPQSNGKAERVNRTIKERVRAALSESGLDEELWAEAAVAAAYVMNRSPKEGQDVTPWEGFTGKRPDVSGLAVWGSRAYALKPPKQIKGTQPRTSAGRMVGYTAGGKGFRLLLDSTKEVVERRDVVVEEAESAAPAKRVHWSQALTGAPSGEDGGAQEATPVPTPQPTPTPTPSTSTSSTDRGGGAPVTPDVQAAIDAARLVTGQLAEDGRESTSEEEDEVTRYPGRARLPPVRFGQDGAGASASAAAVRTADTVEKPVMVRDLPPPPKTVEEASCRDDWPMWEAALEDERQSMITHKVWTKKKAPPGARRQGTRVIFECKADQRGVLQRRKCRLVGRGDRQKPGNDYLQSWAAMPAAATTRAFFATAAARGWTVHHIDVKTAYLYAPMDVEVYIVIPEGFEGAGKDALLQQAMYGTKQAGNLWGKHLDGKLTQRGGVQSKADKCLYTFAMKGTTVYVNVHVDDILPGGPDAEAVADVKRRIARHFECRDMGEVTSYLGMQVEWDKAAGTVTLSNPRHTADLLKEYEMDECKPNFTPMARGVELAEGELLPTGNRYAELVGSLMYLSNQTRPDLAYAVGKLARRMSAPTEGDWRLAKGVLRYLRGTRNMGITYGKEANLEGWVDSDFAGDTQSRKSTTGFVVTLHGGAISWRSRMQRLVATSTAIAEYVAAAEAVKDSLWLRRLAGDLGEYAGPVTLKEDNQACIAMANNEGMSPRTKHVDVCYHLIRDCVATQQVVVVYVPTGEQLADGFTKPLPRDAFTLFREGLGVAVATPVHG
uniref:Polyprotein n=1 Tax=Pyropia yezoensis TaxID=2788 RepID=B5U9G1_PYRYE|nr:polyprotein [Neopyropia yezoensis]